jgi:hypothetical protein
VFARVSCTPGLRAGGHAGPGRLGHKHACACNFCRPLPRASPGLPPGFAGIFRTSRDLPSNFFGFVWTLPLHGLVRACPGCDLASGLFHGPSPDLLGGRFWIATAAPTRSALTARKQFAGFRNEPILCDKDASLALEPQTRAMFVALWLVCLCGLSCVFCRSARGFLSQSTVAAGWGPLINLNGTLFLAGQRH